MCFLTCDASSRRSCLPTLHAAATLTPSTHTYAIQVACTLLLHLTTHSGQMSLVESLLNQPSAEDDAEVMAEGAPPVGRLDRLRMTLQDRRHLRLAVVYKSLLVAGAGASGRSVRRLERLADKWALLSERDDDEETSLQIRAMFEAVTMRRLIADAGHQKGATGSSDGTVGGDGAGGAPSASLSPLNLTAVRAARQYASGRPNLFAMLPAEWRSLTTAAEGAECYSADGGEGEAPNALCRTRNHVSEALAMPRVVFVDTAAGVHLVQASLGGRAARAVSGAAVESCCYVGVDCEWRDPAPECALLQLAADGLVFVIDAFSACRRPQEQATEQREFADALAALLLWLFGGAGSGVVPVGFGFSGDRRHLSSTLAALLRRGSGGKGGAILSFDGVLDLQHRASCGMAALHNAPGKLMSLKSAVELYLGVSGMSKLEQCSDWTERPLRHSQLEYAGLDAHVLLRLRESMVAGVVGH